MTEPSVNQLLLSLASFFAVFAFAVVITIVLGNLNNLWEYLRNKYKSPRAIKAINLAQTTIESIIKDIASSVSEKYKNDGVITKDEALLIKCESINIIVNELSKAQFKIIDSLYGDVKHWIEQEVNDRVDLLVEDNDASTK